jgi:hypothetical protein
MKKKYDQMTASVPPAGSSLVNTTPLGGEVTGLTVATLKQQPPIMLSLRNQNKKKRARARPGAAIPAKIIFSTDDEPVVAINHQPTTTQREADSLPTASAIAFAVPPVRLVPPSELQQLGLIPKNMFVTSVDVEEGMWGGQQQKKKRKKVQEKAWEEEEASLYEQDADVLLPYDDQDQDVDDTRHDASDFSYDEAEKGWEKFKLVSGLEPGQIVGWKVCFELIALWDAEVFTLKELGINPFTYTPEHLLHLARVISVDEGATKVGVIRLVRPGAEEVAFGGVPLDGDEEDGVEQVEEYTTDDITGMGWKAIS